MTARESLWRLLDRLTCYLSGPPDGRPAPSTLPDPDEPGISGRTQKARRRLWRRRYQKRPQGGLSVNATATAAHDRRSTG